MVLRMQDSAANVALEEIEQARDRMSGQVVRTPTRQSPSLTERCGVPVFLKLENQQTTGSFKLRGATNAVQSMPPDAKARGLVTVSTGNHGRALAHAAAKQGVRCVVCLSGLVPSNKVEAIRALGAEICVAGRSQDEAEDEARHLSQEQGLILVSPFDDPAIIAGQGTIGIEILQDVPAAELVLIPLSGGGLAAGIAAAVKALHPQTQIVGVSMERGAAMHASLAAGHPVPVEELPTLADSLGGGIGLTNRYTFAMICDLLDDAVLVSEEAIAEAIRHAHESENQIIEGGAAVGIAALLSGIVAPSGPTVVVVSGGNIDPALHDRIVRRIQ